MSLAAELLSRCRFPEPDSAVTCAVSGGADSLALLVLAAQAGCRVTAVHVDHGLRPESGVEAEIVAAAAERFGADFRSERVHVGAGPNLEARAREARYGVLPADVMVGHTADDQAETVLMALLRGAAWQGMRGMAADHRRPILGLRRSDTEALCTDVGLVPVQDPMNQDPAFTRVRVRNELLPLLADISGRDPVPLLIRQAELFGDGADLIDVLAADIDPTDAKALGTLPRPLARTAVRRWLQLGTGRQYPPDLATVDRVLAVANLEATATDVGGLWEVRRSEQILELRKRSTQ